MMPFSTVHSEDRGSMPMVLLVMLVGLTFGALLVPMIISQDRTTRFDVSRSRSLHAAQSGTEVALGLIRSATPDGVTGDTTKLPCGPLSGSVGGGSGTYTVAVAYYEEDPAPHVDDATWLRTKSMLCSKNYGPYDSATSKYVPSFALLTASGSDGPGVNGASPGRTIQNTYVVKTVNVNVAGGLIQLQPDNAGNHFCMDAGSAVPAAGTVLVTRTCDPASPAQLWSYNRDLSIQLNSSVVDPGQTTVTQGNGLCLDSAVPHAEGNTVTLQYCQPQSKASDGTVSDQAKWNQQWSVNDYAHLFGAKPDRSDLDAYCMVFSAVAKPVTLTTNCDNNVASPTQTWQPQATVGAGAAEAPDPAPSGFLASSHQLVNFKQFGYCLDVTSGNTSKPLITYACKQNPNPSQVKWNQKWSFTRNQWITYPNGTSGTAYCLTSPGTAGQQVTVSVCPKNAAAPTTWRTALTRDSNGAELPYKDKYTIVDATGLCLSASTVNGAVSGYNAVITDACDGSNRQKWNALGNVQTPLLQNLIELPYQAPAGP